MGVIRDTRSTEFVYPLSEDDPTQKSTREIQPTTRHDPRDEVRGGKGAYSSSVW